MSTVYVYLYRNVVIIIISIATHFVVETRNQTSLHLYNFNTSDIPQDTNSTDLDGKMSPRDIILAGMLLPDYQLAQWMGKVPRGIIYVVGLMGNFLAGLVMFQEKNRDVSCYFYMGVLSIMDSIPILLGTTYWILSDLTNTVLTPFSHKIYCNITWPLIAGGILSGTYIILAMTFDRFLAVQFPLKAAVWCTVRRARISCAVIVAVCFIFRLPYFVWTDAIRPMSCVAFQGKQSRLEIVYYWVNTVLSSYVPFILLVTFNTMIIRTLRGRSKYFTEEKTKSNSSINASESDISTLSQNVNNLQIRGEKKGKPSSSSSVSKKSRKTTTFMLLLVSFSFLIFTAPLYMVYVVYMIKPYLESPETYAEFSLVINTAYNLVQLNHCFNFSYTVSAVLSSEKI